MTERAVGREGQATIAEEGAELRLSLRKAIIIISLSEGNSLEGVGDSKVIGSKGNITMRFKSNTPLE